MIKAILAIGENGEIGCKGDLPWGRGLPKDLAYFKQATLGAHVWMGGNTFTSLPFKNGLPDRVNHILTSSVPEFDKVGYRLKDGVYYHNFAHFSNCLMLCSVLQSADQWIVGGKSVYEQIWDIVDEVHLTRVKASFPDADTFFQPDLSKFELCHKYTDVSGEFDAYVSVWRRE